MKVNLKILMAGCAILLMFACKSDSDCSDNFDFSLMTETEHANWRLADAAYNDDMSEENCKKLNEVSDVYINALRDIEDCISDIDRESFDSRITFFTAQKISTCL